ncbi:MAG: hypothetical protein AAF940_05650 [Pseudomonadota bacterium]
MAMKSAIVSGVCAVALSFLSTAIEAYADDVPGTGSQSVAVFGGVFVQGPFPTEALLPLYAEKESNYILGGMYGRDFFHLRSGFHLGGEVGLALRFGDEEYTSGEVWGGVSLRHHGLDVGPITIAPSFVAGLSAVTDPIGIEKERAAWAGTNATLLFYLGPELAFRARRYDQTEFFFRTHHRSGGRDTLSNMSGGHNANVFGIRRRF